MQLHTKKWSILILFIILCTSALIMEWARLLDEAVAEQEALKKCGEWNEWLRSFLSAHSCVYTHTQLIASSFLRINPMLVLTVLPVRLLLAPVEIISATFGKAIVVFNHQLPFVWQLLVFSSTFALLVVAILFKCGYRIRLLGGFLDITPTTPYRQHTAFSDSTQTIVTQSKGTSSKTECTKEETAIKRGHKHPTTARMPAVNPLMESDRARLKKIIVVGNGSRVYLGNVKNEQIRIVKKS